MTGVMSFEEMDAMMYKIEGEDLYLIGTSEHSMIGKFIDTITAGGKAPADAHQLFRPASAKEKGAHGIEERGIYRIHQFEKQEMIVDLQAGRKHGVVSQKLWSYSSGAVPLAGHSGAYLGVLFRRLGGSESEILRCGGVVAQTAEIF